MRRVMIRRATVSFEFFAVIAAKERAALGGGGSWRG